MMFIILDECPINAVYKLPYKICFKQLIELGQLICSAGISNIYKKVPQGKAIQNWIIKNPTYTLRYYRTLLHVCTGCINMSKETEEKLQKIHIDMCKYEQTSRRRLLRPDTAVFRYAKNYKSIYPTNTELCIGNTIKAYEEYMEWKNYDKK